MVESGCQDETPGQTGVPGGGGGEPPRHPLYSTVQCTPVYGHCTGHCIYQTHPHHCDQPSIAIIVMRMLILCKEDLTSLISLGKTQTSKEDFQGTNRLPHCKLIRLKVF